MPFGHFLPHTALLTIAATKPPVSTFLPDSAGWSGEKHRNFSVKSAYSIVAEVNNMPQCKDWDIISQFRGLPRVRVFLWLCYHGSILTNGERQRRHLTEDPSCTICGAVNEDVSHVLRECFVARSLWSRLVKIERLEEFLRMKFCKWLILNVRQPDYFPVHGVDWDVLFGSLLWCLWLKRNNFVFVSAELDSDTTFQRGYRLMEESLRARQIVRCGRSAIVAQSRTMGHWIAPPENWIKINTDGARSITSGILELQQRCWEIQFRFTCREGNIPADIMARLVQQGALVYHRYLDPPLMVREALDADKRSLMAN
ncbi:hypothetical protein V6N11_016527 [Hibiscus sabdariffa]|uniref:Reverse transcriptase zinc-binding domain-containing protein n=1 Tax=Hibiscus sabdariffa TaxID=183260 RepID=A0ABR2TVG5_9ROSI